MKSNPPLRMTRQRRMILEELRKVNTHPSADELYERVRKRLPRISLGTVYRNLEILSKQGEIQNLSMGGAFKRFDGTPENHYHIRCLSCSRIDDVAVDPPAHIESDAGLSTDYTVIGHRLEFLGLCPDCADKPNALERADKADKIDSAPL